jgi:hypothetical protein
MKTMRRDTLRRLVERDRIVLVGSYHYNEMTGLDRFQGDPIPVKMMPADRYSTTPGTCYLYPSDFTSSVGHACVEETGIINLHVHGNCSYNFRLREGAR